LQGLTISQFLEELRGRPSSEGLIPYGGILPKLMVPILLSNQTLLETILF